METINSKIEEHSRINEFKKALHRFKSNKLTLVGFTIILVMVFMAIFADYLAPYPEDAKKAVHFGQQFQSPSKEHPFGTDGAGRDVLSRTIFGVRVSLYSALWVQSIVLIIGLCLGTISGYIGGWYNTVIMRSADILLTLPPLALALVAASTFKPSLNVAIGSITLVWWPWYARLIQSKVLSLKEDIFIEAVESMGKAKLRVIVDDILPNLVSILTVKFTLDMGYVILYTASLSFLGLGIQPPKAAWGLMISTGRKYLPEIWWLSTFPGIFIFLTVLGFALLGDGLRDLLDVKLSY